MSEELQTTDSGATSPTPEHAWLQQLLGEWKTTCDMTMPDGTTSQSAGWENITSLGGLWAVGEGKLTMADGGIMDYRSGIGYDVSFKGYRGFWVMSMSSHLWKYEGTLSEDGKVLTMDCTGPDMAHDGKTAQYRDIHTLLDSGHRKIEMYFPGDGGEWSLVMTWIYTRA